MPILNITNIFSSYQNRYLMITVSKQKIDCMSNMVTKCHTYRPDGLAAITDACNATLSTQGLHVEGSPER